MLNCSIGELQAIHVRQGASGTILWADRICRLRIEAIQIGHDSCRVQGVDPDQALHFSALVASLAYHVREDIVVGLRASVGAKVGCIHEGCDR